jgi:hypothetical protein
MPAVVGDGVAVTLVRATAISCVEVAVASMVVVDDGVG